MAEDTESKTWVLVDEMDCDEQPLPSNPTVGTTTDSDQESDGSIIIISDQSSDCSEEEHENVLGSGVKPIIPIVTIDAAPEINDEDVCFAYAEPDSTQMFEEDVNFSEENETQHENDESHVTSTFDKLSKKNWAYFDDNLNPKRFQRPFFLDCSQEPILEVSQTDTEADTESISNIDTISSNPEWQPLFQTQETFLSVTDEDITEPNSWELVTEMNFPEEPLSLNLTIGSSIIIDSDDESDESVLIITPPTTDDSSSEEEQEPVMGPGLMIVTIAAEENETVQEDNGSFDTSSDNRKHNSEPKEF